MKTHIIATRGFRPQTMGFISGRFRRDGWLPR